MAERVVKVRLSAEVSEYQKGMLEAARQTRAVGTETEKLAQKKEAFESLGRTALGVGAAFTAASVLSVKAAMDWESAWAGVTKTVDGTPSQLAAVEQGLRDLTSVLPASHEEIAAVAEAAGQLGIETENVVAFTRTMIDLGETTNLSANDAAQSLARFMNIMGTSQDKVSNLGSAIVGLGNNYATTESEILAMSMRLAGAGKQIGLSEGDVLGLATALSSVGIEAEAGGSAMSKVMIDIAASVEDGGERVEMFAKVAGMSADEFSAKWRSAPAEALAAFVKGLSNAESQGMSTLGVLAELDITEVRMRDALLRSASAADMFAGAMARGNEEFTTNNALTIEAAKRYETVESRLQIMQNAIRDAAIEFGEVLLPAVGASADAIAGFAGFVGGMPDPVKALVSVFTGLVGVLGLVGGTAMVAVPKIAQFKVALDTMGWSMRGVALAGGAITVGLTVLVTAIGAVIGAQAEAQQKAKAYADTLEAGTHRVTQATRDMVKEALAAKGAFLWIEQDSAYDAAEKLGISLDLVTEAAMGNAAALKELKKQIDEGADGSLAYANSAVDIENAVKGESESLERAIDAAVQKQAADKDSVSSSQNVADAYLESADAADEFADKLDALISKINEANGLGQDAVSANADYLAALQGITTEVENQRKAYEEANGTANGFTLSLDEGTAAGSANAAMLSDVAKAAQDAAAAQFEVDKTTMTVDEATKKYNGTLASQRQAFIDSAIQAGFNADQVRALADRVFALPDAKQIAIMAETAAAQNVIDRFIWANDGRRINLIVDGQVGRQVHGENIIARANGGIEDYQAFADGGFPTGIYKGVPGAIHKFAEPETGWEAYISGKPDQRSRNIGIWQETGRRLGVDAGSSGPVSVSLAGAVLMADMDGTPVRLMIRDQIVQTEAGHARASRGRVQQI